ncbi:hypothetical protein FRUB_10150 [Fimbriiglobus ruber]|uniref:Uncharacterized protein n=1 Tax=Fimbriiglobus ruber TaxID=1908690 RepID=A0A225DAL9_9BACT|nr:hypothetical protein FRUB_10150 [Fimbriiglobus ruber]
MKPTRQPRTAIGDRLPIPSHTPSKISVNSRPPELIDSQSVPANSVGIDCEFFCVRVIDYR